jgi:hypothetical protein
MERAPRIDLANSNEILGSVASAVNINTRFSKLKFDVMAKFMIDYKTKVEEHLFAQVPETEGIATASNLLKSPDAKSRGSVSSPSSTLTSSKDSKSKISCKRQRQDSNGDVNINDPDALWPYTQKRISAAGKDVYELESILDYIDKSNLN